MWRDQNMQLAVRSDCASFVFDRVHRYNVRTVTRRKHVDNGYTFLANSTPIAALDPKWKYLCKSRCVGLMLGAATTGERVPDAVADES